jgi:hypothetical protein
MRIHARPCATTVPASRLDRHATYIVATFVAGSSRGDTAPPASSGVRFRSVGPRR